MKLFYLTLLVILVGTASPARAQSKPAGSELPTLIVYKNPSCGCCSKWIEHIEDYGFKAKVYTTKNADLLKDRLGVPRGLRSCHVAQVGGYLVEGHVPADLIEKLLNEQPDVAGLTVPGMVVGSPGMEGHNPQHYEVLTFTEEGETAVFAKR